jgi:hypothetical protein
MPETYPALTIWQPWATLITEGLKPYEFRTWPAPRSLWGKRIAIHASARKVKREEVQDLLLRIRKDGARTQRLRPGAEDLLERALSAPGILPLSSVLCIATLGEPLAPRRVKAAMGRPDEPEGDFNWAWPLTDIERLEPFVPASGAQGFWAWERPNG